MLVCEVEWNGRGDGGKTYDETTHGEHCGSDVDYDPMVVVLCAPSVP